MGGLAILIWVEGSARERLNQCNEVRVAYMHVSVAEGWVLCWKWQKGILSIVAR